MQHFEQIDLDKIDELITTEDQEDDPLEVSLMQTQRTQESPFSKLRQLMALGMIKGDEDSQDKESASDKSIGDYLQQDAGQSKSNERKPMCDIVQGLKDNYGSSDSES